VNLSFHLEARLPKRVHYRMSDLFSLVPHTLAHLSVFATRVGTSKPYWQPMGARYEWERFAAATTPRLPEASKTSSRTKIPWPKQIDRPTYQRVSYIFSHA
jgi:hypothetical protein